MWISQQTSMSSKVEKPIQLYLMQFSTKSLSQKILIALWILQQTIVFLVKSDSSFSDSHIWKILSLWISQQSNISKIYHKASNMHQDKPTSIPIASLMKITTSLLWFLTGYWLDMKKSICSVQNTELSLFKIQTNLIG